MTRFNLYLNGYRKLARKKTSYLHATGWDNSYREKKPLDGEGNPVPWMNYPVISFLKERLHSNMHLFEFGSGYSTFFYAARVRSVTSVEYSPHWYKRIKDGSPENVNVLFREKDRDGLYAKSITDSPPPFDVVVVDGIDRYSCIKRSVYALSDTGVILLDDSQRERYAEAINFLRAEGFRVLHFEGLKPCGYKLYRTSVFYRPGNCFNI
jgi:hypothetical protein